MIWLIGLWLPSMLVGPWRCGEHPFYQVTCSLRMVQTVWSLHCIPIWANQGPWPDLSMYFVDHNIKHNFRFFTVVWCVAWWGVVGVGFFYYFTSLGLLMSSLFSWSSGKRKWKKEDTYRYILLLSKYICTDRRYIDIDLFFLISIKNVYLILNMQNMEK